MRLNYKNNKRRTWRHFIVPVAAISLLTGCTQQANKVQVAEGRQKLPVAQPRPEKVTKVLPSENTMPKPFSVDAPKGAPNVVVILLDDVGYGAPSTFGGKVNMPTLQKLADNGLSYNNFHTTALCAPTRSALKGGRNHHVMNFGSIPEIATGFAGNTTLLPDYAQPIAEILRLNGYNTAAFGKWHETPGKEMTAAGPQVRWPTRQGFEKFYGFVVGAEDNMWDPTIHDGVTLVEPQEKENYHFLADMTDKSIAWMRAQKSLKPDKPFFIYYASAGSHAPHHAPKSFIKKYKGKFDQGWDKTRKEIFKQQKKLGVIPQNTQLVETPSTIPVWNDMTAQQKKVFARQAEVFAAYTEYSDYEAGRLIDAIDDMGQLDNTLVVYISGDNGTSAEGDASGQWNWNHFLNGIPESPAEQEAYLEKWGNDETYPMIGVGWAIAFNSPFGYTKQVAGDFGGTKNGTVVHWPNGIKAKGEIRQQFTHVIDVVPTILEAANIEEPKVINGIEQIPIQGTSMVYSFDNADAPERHKTQYFEIIGNRGIYDNGWLARATVSLPWEGGKKIHSVEKNDGWQLYNTKADYSLANDLASKYPKKLEALKEKFMEEAIANQVLPLDDRLLPRLIPNAAGRTTLLGDRTKLTLYPGAYNIVEDVLLNFKNKSSTVTADINTSKGRKENGVIFSQGGRFGGWSIYVEDGAPGYAYNYLGKLYKFKSRQRLKNGNSKIRVDVDYDGGGLEKGPTLSSLLTVSKYQRVDWTKRLPLASRLMKVQMLGWTGVLKLLLVTWVKIDSVHSLGRLTKSPWKSSQSRRVCKVTNQS